MAHLPVDVCMGVHLGNSIRCDMPIAIHVRVHVTQRLFLREAVFVVMKTKLHSCDSLNSRISSRNIPAFLSMASEYKRILHFEMCFFTFLHVQNKVLHELSCCTETVAKLHYGNDYAELQENRQYAEGNNNNYCHEQTAQIYYIKLFEWF